MISPAGASIAQLVVGSPGARLASEAGMPFCDGVTQDSRAVQPGWLFVAVRGLERDGHAYIPQAVAAGAVAVAGEPPLEVPPGVAAIEVPSARAALADFSATLHGHPSNRLTLVGITGTDGKTSTTQILGAILEALGRRIGWLTTASVRVTDEIRSNTYDHTTPEAPVVQGLLAEMVEQGVECALLEVSSHALALERVRGCNFDLAIFTNLSPEHLNFHGDLAAYRDAKARLFASLDPSQSKGFSKLGVINADDPAAATMTAACRAPIVRYGLQAPAEYSAGEVQLSPRGSRFAVESPLGAFPLETKLLGGFNVANWLAATAAAFALGARPEHVQLAAGQIGPVRGRMEPVDCGQPFLVIVDFAHTPQALETALRTLRPHTSGRLFTLFGQAGGRDPANRPAMGAIATHLSDYFLVTTDDPLHEDPGEIAEAIAAGATNAGARRGKDFDIELDRSLAISQLIARARSGDTVLLAGKGHEQRMLVGDHRLPWDDAGEARRALGAR